MPTINDYAFLPTNANTGVWVRLVNNATTVAYVSAAATDGNGEYSITAPAGQYTVYTGPTATGAWTATGDAAYTIPEVAVDGAWRVVGAGGQPAFQNSWAAGNNGVDPNPQFRKLGSGLVLVEGYVVTGTGGTAAFTLPAGYRPAARVVFSALTGASAFTYVQISAAGAVSPATGSSSGTNMGSMMFFADQ